MKPNLYKNRLIKVSSIYTSNIEDILNTLNTTFSFNNVNYTLHVENKENLNKTQPAKAKIPNSKLVIPQQDGFVIIKKADILYCEADDNYTKIYLRTQQKYLVSKTLKYFEEALDTTSFARVHKSYIVNVNDIVKYAHKGKTGSIVLSNGQEVMVSASKKANLMTYFK